MRIKDLNGFAQGVGIFEEGEHQGMVGFVPHTLPGDIIEPKTIEIQKRIGLVKSFSLLTPSPIRGQAHCEHCTICPGCNLHSMRTEEYKSLKETVLKNLLRGPLKEQKMALVCLNQTGFRNKLVLHWNQQSNSLAYADDLFLSDITQCPVAEAAIQEMIKQIPQALTNSHGIHKIYLKSLPDNQTVLGVICKQKPDVSKLQNRLGNISDNIFWQRDCNPFTISNYQWVQKQKEPLYEKIENHQLYWLPEAFFQTNRFILNRIIQTLREWIPKQAVVWDLYCGIGTLLFGISDQVLEGYGIEFSPVAISCAKKSAENLKTLSFECLDLTKEVHRIPKDWKKPEVILVNPPRQGISQELMRQILKMNCAEIIYMSCNPITLERDLKPLLKSGYGLEQSLAFDMFPNTAHFEILTHLKKRL